MRVLLVSPDFPPTPSGMGDYTDHLGHELAARGHDVVVLCKGPAETRTKVDVRPLLPSMNRRSAAVLDSLLADIAPDAILWQYNPFQVGHKGLGPAAGLIARTFARHAPLVVVAHELWFPWARQGLRGAAWAVAQRLETASVVAAATRFVVTTDRRCETLLRWFPDRTADITSIPIGATIEPDPTRPLNGTRARYGLADDDVVLAHVGSIGAGRNLAPVYDALRALRSEGIPMRLLCIGRTGLAEPPSDLGDAVRFTGLLAREDVSDALRASDVYVFCEPSGPAAGRKTSLLAALAHGLPIVALRGRDHDPGLVDGHNVRLVRPREVAAALRALAKNRDERASLGTAGRRLYHERFSWPVVGDRFEEILRGL